ncbi:TPA: hypothetical protein L6814_000597 [Clostridioides difficile]|nr:Uncharacterised protein [Clostridioides difficile]VIG70229.1 Uncharacterised protein [Clostridioides difficile]HAU5068873.1 hypothetical protein [Clostridioides difficile]HAU5230942.1 hypothetical protein [Clostridioides difficile]HAU5259220.1 hypothetical protein [Clostridioides difficile]
MKDNNNTNKTIQFGEKKASLENNIQKNKNIKLDNTHKVIPYPKNRRKDDKKKGNKKKNTNTSKVNKNNYGHSFFNNKYKYKRKPYVIALYTVILILLAILIITKLTDSTNKGTYSRNTVSDTHKNDIRNVVFNESNNFLICG